MSQEGVSPMREEEKIFAGKMFYPFDEELCAIKLRTHNLNLDYNATYHHETEKREKILKEIFLSIGEESTVMGPMYLHYGKHTTIGKRFFANFNLVIQDDGKVTIGDDCNFGPNVTIVTPKHPLLPDERRLLLDIDGQAKHMCYALPVTIGNDCWLAAGVTVCGGVTIGNNCVIGAGSVVTRDIPDNSFAAGVPCRVIRTITEADSMKYKPEIMGDKRVIE